MSLGRAFATVSSLTLLSRCTGLARDVAIAAALGSGPVAEAFFVALRIPNLFRRLFAEGAFAVAFVPMFSRRLESEGRYGARDFAERALAALAAALLAITAAGHAAMPWLIYAFAGGFADRPETLDLATLYARITFPYLLLVSLTAFFSGVLNALRRFAAAAAAPVLLNLCMIGGISLAAAGDQDPGAFLAWSVPVAGVLQLLLVAVAAGRAGMRLGLRKPRIDPDVRRLLTLAAPAALAAGVYQINLLVGTLVASFFAGAVAWLQYADRLYQLPLGVVGVALGVVLLPELSRRIAAGDDEGARDSLCRSVEIAAAFSVPSTVALLLIPGPVVSVLFERGAFAAGDTRETALVLALFATGLPAYMLGKIYASVFFAREDTRTPTRLAAATFALNTALAVGGAALFNHLAIPVATSIAAWLLLGLLIRAGRHFDELRPDGALLRRLPRIAVASLVMGAALLALREALAPALVHDPHRYAALAALVLGGMAVYGGCGLATGAFRIADIRGALVASRGAHAGRDG